MSPDQADRPTSDVSPVSSGSVDPWNVSQDAIINDEGKVGRVPSLESL